MRKPINLRSFVAVAVTAALAGGAVNAVAADKSAPAAEPSERLVYVPHKSGYPFNFFRVPNERAEFARVEIAPDARPDRVAPPPKTGNPFLHN